MHDIAQAAILGVVQGLTEFLPVSSSGHLVISQQLLGMREPELLLDVMLHVGTLFAVLVVFRSDIAGILRELLGALKSRSFDAPGARTSVFIVIGTVPAGLLGVLFKDDVEMLFGSIPAVGFAFMGTGLLLIATRHRGGGRSDDRLGAPRALLVGVFQALALVPGISRSGSTIAAGLFAGLDREAAVRFSFLLSLPVILGAALLQGIEAGQHGMRVPLDALLVGTVVSALVGYGALRLLILVALRDHLWRFSFYLLPLGVAVLLFTDK